VGFLLAFIELFSLGVTAICSKSAISLQRRPDDPKFHIKGVASHQPFFLLEN